MPAIPDSTKSSIRLRLLDHAERHWPQLARVDVTYRGAFAYVAGGRYQEAMLRTGLPAGTPQEALDTACTVHLAGLSDEPGR